MIDPGGAPAGPLALPMFPLGTVLFPGAVLPLHVFEPRFRALTRHCLEGDRTLGVVLIERGNEVGGGDTRFSVGTRARIVEAAGLADGRWVLALIGWERIRVVRWLPEEPFPMAEVETVVDRGPATGGRRAAVERLLRRSLALKAELGEPTVAPATVSIDEDPASACWQAAAAAPIGPADAQRVLETDGLDARFALVEQLLDEEVVVLAHRVGGR
jgi:Lon protease-like protein